MALLLHSSSIAVNKLHLLHSSLHYFLYQSKSQYSSIIKCQDSSSSLNSSNPEESTTTVSSIALPSNGASPPLASAGLGFGNSPNSTTQIASKKKTKGKKDRASIIRRDPLANPNYDSRKEEIQIEEKSVNERGFLLAWIGLGAVIILEGIVLASSGFLPEEWDKFIVKYLYPYFTPTVLFFVAGTTAYGLINYLRNHTPKKT